MYKIISIIFVFYAIIKFSIVNDTKIFCLMIFISFGFGVLHCLDWIADAYYYEHRVLKTIKDKNKSE